MKDFLLTAGGLTKNPLGIVGLFVCLVYGLACAVFLANGRNFSCGENWILVSFVAFFPCVILFVFYRLVTLHHKKLYAPSDYKNEQNFMSMMSDEQISKRLDEEIESNAESSSKDVKNSVQTSGSNLGPGLVARQGKTNTILFNADEKKLKRSEYGDAKRLAFLALEKLIGKPFTKYVKFTVDGNDFELDGYLETESEIHVIDVIYLENPEKIDDYVNTFVKKISPVFNRNSQIIQLKKHVWVGVVYAFTREKLHESGTFGVTLKSDHNIFNLTVNTRYLSMDELKKTYG